MTRFIALILTGLLLTACTPLMVQQAGKPPLGFQGPRLEANDVVSFDWRQARPLRMGCDDGRSLGGDRRRPRMNDYANAFHMAAPWWASEGITTIAYDQRGFGRSPGRGVWAGDELMVEDLRTVAALARQKIPRAVLVVAGESLGGAVAAEAFASDRPPTADRLVLLSPAVWGWRDQPLPYKTLLWFAANFTGPKVYTPPRWLTSKVSPTDNLDELIAMAGTR